MAEDESSSKDKAGVEEFTVRCHCGRLRGVWKCKNPDEVRVAWDCNCSDCGMRKNIHTIVPAADFVLPANLEQVSTLYRWGTGRAVRRFCATCGILPWYTPRSNPDGVGITVSCIDWGSRGPPEIRVVQFDGIHWEESMLALNSDLSAKI